MAAGTVAVSDVIVPSVFAPYVQQLTTEKSRIIQSGVAQPVPEINSFLAAGAGGLTANIPSWKDLDTADAENVSSDTGSDSTPNKIGTSQMTVVRLSRNNSWATADLVATLAGADPAASIASRVSDYWVRRQQAAFIAVMKGIFADNDAATDAYHTQYDMLKDIKGASFTDGTTNFTPSAFIDACVTMGDSMDDLSAMFVHSVVFARMQKLQLITTVSMEGPAGSKIEINTYLGKRVIVDDSMPNTSGVFDTWIFGQGSFGIGQGFPTVPAEVDRKPASNNGGGGEVLFSRVEWCLAPLGYAYIGTSPVGGPSNAATTNNLAAAGSWRRVFPQRKMIKIARLVTREF